MSTAPEDVDCLVVGGGPAGLLAAVYLGRFRRRVLVADAGDGRALRIPCLNNCPGFPEGISGRALVDRLRRQAVRYGADFIDGRVSAIMRDGSGFAATCGTVRLRARRLLLATGVRDTLPDLPEIDENIARRTLCVCPVCDGYEATDKRIGVMGRDDHALREAIFLRTYSQRVSLLPWPPGTDTAKLRADAAKAGITLCEDIVRILSDEEGYVALLRDGSRAAFDVIYPALGYVVRGDLGGGDIDMRRDDLGHVRVDAHQQTSVPGIYAAGDVVHSLNQIAVALGQAVTAATAIHNDLRATPQAGESGDEGIIGG